MIRIVYWTIVGVLLLVLWVVVRAERRKRPNWWNHEGSADYDPDPRCERFPDWKVHTHKRR